MMQDADHRTIFVVGHNPQLTDTANMFIDEHIAKIPTAGIIAINFDIQEWSELEDTVGEIDFFIYPKQFKYYVPKQIRAVLDTQYNQKN
jgi:phosphohistidine phosphatase